MENHRRPADVWLPKAIGASGEALDLACTSGLRTDVLARSEDEPGAVFAFYEHLKNTYKNTAQECKHAGFSFTPLILEAHGGSWSPLARSRLDKMAKLQTAAWLEGHEPPSLRIAQRISCTLQRENARAVLRRLAHPAPIVATGGTGADCEVVM